MTPHAILFDCDGVLVDSESIFFELIKVDLAQYGLTLSTEELGQLFLGGTLHGAFLAARKLGANLPDGWVDEFYEHLYARLAEGTELIRGILPLLDQLDAAGIRYAICSNGAPRKMEITLGQHPGLMERFRGHIYSGQELGCPKPEPGLWLHAARALGVAPAECAAVDDSPAGCTGAVRAGIRCLGLAEHDDGARLNTVGAEVIHGLAEIPARIGL
ncbi:MAG: HAD family hydrolase [Pseudorhodobacter sp.]